MKLRTLVSDARVWLALGLLGGCSDPMEIDAPPADATAAATDAGEADDATSPTDATSGMEDAAPSVDAVPQPRDANPADDGIPQAANVVPIVTPSVCTTQNQHLRHCGFGPRTFEAPAVGPGDYRTIVTAHKLGNCSSAYPISPLLSADGIEPFTYVLFWNERALLRRDDSAALDAIVVSRDSGFADIASYDLSCRVWLEVDFNVPIVTGQP